MGDTKSVQFTSSRDDAPAWTVRYGEETWRRAHTFDVTDAVDRVSHAIDRTGRVEARSYTATFGGGGLVFEAEGGNTLHLRTTSIKIGDDVVYRGEATRWSILGNTAQAALADHIVEHHEALSAGVEVTWIFQTPVAADIVIATDVTGVPFRSKSADGLHYGNVNIGNAELVDAAGKRWPIETTLVDGSPRWRIDATLLADATYPIALDPAVSAELPVHPGAPTTNEANPSVASNGTDYLVVWGDFGFGLHATRMAPDGAIKDPAGITLATQGVAPAIASNGTDYFVVWSDLNRDIDGARVLANGSVPAADSAGIRIQTGGADFPSVASNGADYFVTWDAAGAPLEGRPVSSSGTVGASVAIDACGGVTCSPSYPTVASNGVHYLVAYTTARNTIVQTPTGPVTHTSFAQRGTLVAPNLTTTPVAITSDQLDIGQGFSRVASNGTSFLVTWTDARNPTGNVFAARVTAAGAVPDFGGFAIAQNAAHQDDSSVASNGTDYLVVWVDVRSGDDEIYGARVTAAGTVPPEDAGGFVIAPFNDPSWSKVAPRATGAAGLPYLVVYEVREALHRVAARLITLGCGNGIVETIEACDDGNLTAGDGCGRTCRIETGYTCAGSPSTCTDVDECSLNTDNCDQNCANTPGGFSCSCNTNYVLQPDGHTCDLDECATNNGGCAHTCTNTVGSFTCSCAAGYTLAADGRACNDINECLANNGGCAQTCTNTPGSRTCGCNTGFTLDADGTSCNDINECGTNNGGCAQFCTNTIGSRECACNAGYALGADGASCNDVNECAVGNGGCAQVCNNTPGSSTCACFSGYVLSGNGVSCNDIDECAINNGSCSHTCINTPGAYVCACPDGFALSSDGHTCEDVDECASSPCSTDPSVPCTNTTGGFSCGACPSGYTGDGRTCADIDECAAHTDNCSTNATCTNTAGGYICRCQAGYEGNGVACAADSGGGCSSQRETPPLLLGIALLFVRRRRKS